MPPVQYVCNQLIGNLMQGMIFHADKFHGNELQEINKIKLKKKNLQEWEWDIHHI